MPMPEEPIKINFVIKLGFWKVGKAKELAARIDLIYERIKAATGKGLDYQYFKRPWKTDMTVSVRGYPDTVRRFLYELRIVTETMGLKVSPEDWWKI